MKNKPPDLGAGNDGRMPASPGSRRRFPRTTKQESETHLCRDEVAGVWRGDTASLRMAKKWARLRYPVRVLGCYPGGEPRTWATEIPLKAITFRALVDGRLPERPPLPQAFRKRHGESAQEGPGMSLGARDHSRENAADSGGEGADMGSPAADAPSPSPLVEGAREVRAPPVGGLYRE
jgi:hypothetical protein